jgi:Ca2+-transporting ATPase
MERALNEFAKSRWAKTEHLHDDWILVREYSLSPTLMALSQVWRSPTGQNYVIAVKGAPEAIIDPCHFRPEEAQAVFAWVSAMAHEGLRVLGVARAYFQQYDLPNQRHDFDFEFLGLIGLADPVRPGVQEAVRECYSAGTIGLLCLVLFIPFCRSLFRFSALHLHDFAICLAAAICSVFWFELFKL